MAWVNLLDIVYPVGSLYFTNNDTSPAAIVGGSWSQIEPGTFLMAAGESYNVLSTGGANAHTLTVSEMPSHRHSANALGVHEDYLSTSTQFAYTALRSVTRSNPYGSTEYVSYVGSGSAHNNMPKYIAVNIYYRTA